MCSICNYMYVLWTTILELSSRRYVNVQARLAEVTSQLPCRHHLAGFACPQFLSPWLWASGRVPLCWPGYRTAALSSTTRTARLNLMRSELPSASQLRGNWKKPRISCHGIYCSVNIITLDTFCRAVLIFWKALCFIQNASCIWNLQIRTKKRIGCITIFRQQSVENIYSVKKRKI